VTDITSDTDFLKLVSEIVAAYVGNNQVLASELPAVIKTVHSTLGSLSTTAEAESQTNQKPAVIVKKSVTPEYLVCLEDGKRLKMMKRYLRSHYGMTPEQYRTKWGLPPDYPMVASAYAAKRSEFAKKIGLGKPAARSHQRA
jgi:predicted transcriptional regulator